MSDRVPNPIDRMVGQNIRFQRSQQGMSQEALGERLGVTFQQVQKYEKGANRTSASRLVQIASVLQVDVIDLFDGTHVPKGRKSTTVTDLLVDPKALELLQVFGAVKNKRLRNAIVDLVSRLADSA